MRLRLFLSSAFFLTAHFYLIASPLIATAAWAQQITHLAELPLTIIPSAYHSTTPPPQKNGAESEAPLTTNLAHTKRAGSAPLNASDEVARVDDPAPSLTPQTASATLKMADVYRRIADNGDWGDVRPLSLHERGAKVRHLRERLAMEGDMTLKNARASDVFDKDVTLGLINFQTRMGLPPSGRLTKATRAALNVPARERARALAATALRLNQMRLNFAERYVVVNLPAASVEAIDHGQVVRRYDAIMGDADHQSPDVTATIQAVNLNPTWTVPASIIKNELIPKMREDKNYLSKLHIRIFDGHNVEIQPNAVDWSNDSAATLLLRQDSGDYNSLGQIRINMPNRYAVYMHDTPAKHLFKKADHFLSHGCVRVRGVYDLAAWVLEKTTAHQSIVSSASSPLPLTANVWTINALRDKVATHEMTEIRLAKDIPVMWVYMTGWVSADGRTHFRPDVYQRDLPPPAPAKKISIR